MGLDALTTGGFMAAFALALGANNFQIGLLAALPFILQPLQIPAIILVEKFQMRKPQAFITTLVSHMIWLPIAAIPFIIDAPGNNAVMLLLVLVFVRSAITPFSNAPWMSWLRDLVPPDIRGRFFGRRLAYATAVGMVLGISGALFADYWRNRPGLDDSAVAQGFAYPILFGALTLGLLSIFFIARMPEPRMPAPVGEKRSLVSVVGAPFRDTNFRKLVRFQMFTTLAMHLSIPFLAVYMIQVIGLPISAVMALTALSQLSNILFLGPWGNMVDRFGAKSVLGASSSLYFLVILGWAFTTLPDRYFLTIPLLILLHILAGIATAGLNVTNGTIAMKLSPAGQATSYMSASSLAISLGAGIAPLVGGQFVDFFDTRSLAISIEFISSGNVTKFSPFFLTGFDFLFAISFLLGLVFLGFLAAVKEEGEASREDVMNELLMPARSLTRQVSSVPGMGSLAVYPLGYVSRAPVPGLDIALGVTSYQIAETVRGATRAAATGRDVSSKVVDAVERSVDEIRSSTELAGDQVADLARNVVRGAVQATSEIPGESSEIVGNAVRGLLRSLRGSRRQSERAAHGVGIGLADAAAKSDSTLDELVHKVIESVRNASEFSDTETEEINSAIKRGSETG